MGMADPIETRCCIAGGGPAGMVLGFLLARAGVDVVVLEKHGDFLRDFRGDTIHPSTLEVMHELGLLDAFLERPHDELHRIGAQIGDQKVKVADFTHLPTRCKYVAFMPQWEFLNFFAEAGNRYPHFHLLMEHEATGLIEENGQVVGVRCGERAIRAYLTVAADGRHSTLRAAAGLIVEDSGAPIDVLWFRLSRRETDPGQTLGRIVSGRMMVTLDRGDYWQCAYVIRKGSLDALKERGIDSFRADVAQLAPYLEDRVGELGGWDDVKLLTVAVDHLRQWHRQGLVCIGDAAHAMSPVGGVGINLAIQDAVATANLLAEPLYRRAVTPELLASVQRRREWPARMTQRMQIMIQNRIFGRVLGNDAPISPPWILRLIDRWPLLQRIPARLVGLGVRPEHVRSAEAVLPA
ncbi:MAG TPA: FAD-dependent oxidoreductase [Aliidongia sp.]|nr:FAD-dependent oxidoreductase [Aliidongia sp.]